MSVNTRYHPGSAAGCPAALTASNKASANNEAGRLHLNRSLSGAAQGPVTSLPSAPPRSNRRLSEACGKGLSPCHRVSQFCCWGIRYRISNRLSIRNFSSRFVILNKSAAPCGVQPLFSEEISPVFRPCFRADYKKQRFWNFS